MLETIIEENTAAMVNMTKALVAAIKSNKSAGAKSGSTDEAAPARKTASKKTAAAKKGTTAVSVKAVSDLLLSVVDAVGREAVVDILATFKAKRVKDVPKEKYAALVKKLKAALADAKAAAEEEAEEPDDDDDFGDFDDDDDDFGDFDDDDD